MIKNIIFDLGNVLINFNPEKYLLDSGLGKDETDFLMREVFGSSEWVELDRGTISSEEALDAIKGRNAGQEEIIDRYSDFRPLLTPIRCNTDQLAGLKDRGYSLYYLTNYHSDLFDYTFSTYDFFRLFDGGVVSAHVKKIKPDKAIFRIILEKYGLSPGRTLFIDDSGYNTASAGELGFETIHLTAPELLKEELEKKLFSE